MPSKGTTKALLLFVFFSFPLSWGVAQSIRFEKVWGGPEKDRPFELVRSYAQGYMVCGASSNYASDNQAFLYEFDSLGDPLWHKGYGGNGTERFKSVTRTLDSGYAAAGITSSDPSGDYQIYLVKTDEEGDTIWTKSYGGKDWENVKRIVALPDSGYLIGANSYSYGKGSSDLFLLRVDEKGTPLWQRSFGQKEYDELHELILNQDSTEAYLAGEVTDTASTDSVISYLAHIDTSGTLIREERYALGQVSRFRSLVELSNEKLVVLAGRKDSIGDDPDMALIKYDTLGNMIWKRDFPEPEVDIGQKLRKTKDGGFVISAWTTSYGNGKKDIWLIKTGALGYLEWGRTFGAPEDEKTHSLIALEDSGYATAGITTSYGTSQRNIYLIKTDHSGDAGGNVMVGLERTEKADPEAKNSSSIYPNPANEELKVRFADPSKEGVRSVRIRSLQGRLLRQRSFEATPRVKRIRTEGLPQGVKLLELYRGDERIAVHRLIVRH